MVDDFVRYGKHVIGDGLRKHTRVFRWRINSSYWFIFSLRFNEDLTFSITLLQQFYVISEK